MMVLKMFTGLKGFLGAFSLFSWFPATWPFAGAVMAVLKAVGAFIRMVFNGLTTVVSNPVTLVATAFIAVCALFYGIKLGIELDGKRAAAAEMACNARVGQIEQKLNAHVAAAVERALKASDKLTPLPKDLAKACQRSASCRKGAL